MIYVKKLILKPTNKLKSFPESSFSLRDNSIAEKKCFRKINIYVLQGFFDLYEMII